MSAPLSSTWVPDGPLACDLVLHGAGDAAFFQAWAATLDEAPRTVRLEGAEAAGDLPALVQAFTGKGAEVEILLRAPFDDLEPLFVAVKPLVGIPALFLEARGGHLDEPGLERSLRLGAQMALPMNLRVRMEPAHHLRLDDFLALSERAGGKRTVFWRDCRETPGGEPGWEEAFLADLDARASEGYRIALEGCVPACAHPRLRGRGCSGGLTSVRVDGQGRVCPCAGAEAVGTLADRRLQDLWRAVGMEAWRSRRDPRCADCSLHPTCGSAGKARAGPDPLVRGPQALPALSPARWEAIATEARPYLTGRRQSQAVPVRAEPGRPLRASGARRGAEVVYDARNFRQAVLVERRHDDLLDRLNGMHTRAELESRFGTEGRDLLQRLYLERLVSFLPPVAAR